MLIVRCEEGERETLLQASKLMLVSARTAPKSGDVEDILAACAQGQNIYFDRR